MTTNNKYREEWKKKYKHLIGQFYPDHFCACSNHCKIKIDGNHCYVGVPTYLKGHNIKDGGSPMLRPEVAAKLSTMMKKKNRTAKHNDITKELCKFRKGVEVPGPTWWKNFDDFVKAAMFLYNLEYKEAKHRILKVLWKKDLTQLSIVIFLNWTAGHNFAEISEKYGISSGNVIQVLKNFEKIWPGICQSQITLTNSTKILSYELLFRWEYDIVTKF